MQPFVRPDFECWTSNSVEASRLASFQRPWNDLILNTLDQISIKEKLKSQIMQFERYKQVFQNDWAWILTIPAFKKLTPA